MKKSFIHPHSTTVCLPLFLSLLTAMTALATPEAKAASGGVPRVVVNILVDQLRSDYLNAFMPLYGQEGFVRLLHEGRVYTQAEYPHYRPDRASASATIATGTSPCDHGVVGLRWMDRQTLRPVFCVDNKQYAGILTDDCSAPTFLAVSTLGDELKVASEGRSIVYAIAPYRDAAILSAGHAADGALWIDDHTGNWCTTSYYGAGIPSWAMLADSQQPLADRLKSTVWKPSNELVGKFSYFLSGGMQKPFAHKFNKGDSRYATFKTSGLVNEEVTRMAQQCLNGTLMGADGITDYLAVTYYAGNLEHRTANQAPMELQDTYVRLDKALARLIETVERKVGAGNALFVLTSTGYTDEENGDLSKYRIPSGTFDVERAAALLNMYLVAVYGQGNYIEATLGTQLYLNHRLIEEKQKNLGEVLERTQDFLLQLAGVKDVYTSSRLMQGAWTPGISRIRSGYCARYSGDVLIEVLPGWHFVNQTARENQLVRDSYVAFPIIFFGTGCETEQVSLPVTTDRIAPTVSKAVRIRAPNACSAAPLF